MKDKNHGRLENYFRVDKLVKNHKLTRYRLETLYRLYGCEKSSGELKKEIEIKNFGQFSGSVLNNLSKKNYIKRYRKGRNRVVEITEEGRKLVDKILDELNNKIN